MIAITIEFWLKYRSNQAVNFQNFAGTVENEISKANRFLRFRFGAVEVDSDNNYYCWGISLLRCLMDLATVNFTGTGLYFPQTERFMHVAWTGIGNRSDGSLDLSNNTL